MDEIYIKLLQEAKQELTTDGTSFIEFDKKITLYKLKVHSRVLYTEIYSATAATNDGKVHMNMQAYLSLLEYEELKHALESAKSAKKQARTAILVSIGLGLIQVLLWFLEKKDLINF